MQPQSLVPARRPNKEAAHIGPWGGLMCAVSLGFGGVGTQAQRCDLWPHADKTGVSKGVPFGTRLCKAKCSVLYLLARLTRETGVSCMDTPVFTGRKADRFL
ncbi:MULTISPECIES: hypothetical protein [Christensenella]|uniref:hypothetical protein n=1 Tax=Christensenella TaxID=990721 RepID=UPI0011CA43EE|nr:MULTISPECIES: hypothetical protein [Christensenella]